MFARYSHSFHAFNNSVKLLGINQMCAIGLGHLVYSQTLKSSPQGWCATHVWPGQGLSGACDNPEASMGFCLPHWGVFQDFHRRLLGSS